MTKIMKMRCQPGRLVMTIHSSIWRRKSKIMKWILESSMFIKSRDLICRVREANQRNGKSSSLKQKPKSKGSSLDLFK